MGEKHGNKAISSVFKSSGCGICVCAHGISGSDLNGRDPFHSYNNSTSQPADGVDMNLMLP